MTRKTFRCILSAEAGLLLALTVLTDCFPGAFSSLMAFPFEQIGAGLRALSLTGRVGNGLALALLLLLPMLPLIPPLKHSGAESKVYRWEDAALVVTAFLLLLVLTGMANPVMLYDTFPGLGAAALPVMKAIMGGTVWSMLVCWAVLRLLRLFKSGGTAELYAYLRALLFGLCVLFVGVIMLTSVRELIFALGDIQRPLDVLMALVRFPVSALPYVMDLAITFRALALLEHLLAGEREQAAAAAGKLSGLCCAALAAVTAATAGLNVLQLVLAQYISDVMTTVSIPLTSLAFVLAALLLSRLIAENGRLSDENDSFI